MNNYSCLQRPDGKLIFPKSGIYIIRGPIPGTPVYVGSSINLYVRMNQHILSLKRGDHFNSNLIKLKDSFGLESLDFIVFKEVSEHLKDHEDAVMMFCREKVGLLNKGLNSELQSSFVSLAHTNIPLIATNVETNEQLRFNSLSEAYFSGYSPSTISLILRGKRQSNIYKGYLWQKDLN
jgi:hypothetical protein